MSLFEPPENFIKLQVQTRFIRRFGFDLMVLPGWIFGKPQPRQVEISLEKNPTSGSFGLSGGLPIPPNFYKLTTSPKGNFDSSSASCVRSQMTGKPISDAGKLP